MAPKVFSMLRRSGWPASLACWREQLVAGTLQEFGGVRRLEVRVTGGNIAVAVVPDLADGLAIIAHSSEEQLHRRRCVYAHSSEQRP